jgi:predicted phosphohydrolase
MKIQYCSDLHLEFPKNNEFLNRTPFEKCADILILAGDIAPLHSEHLSNPFLRYLSQHFEQVFWIPGNHEYYFTDIADFEKPLNFNILNNIKMVNNTTVTIDDVTIIFSTLWSKISPINEKIIEQSVSDFSCIVKNKKRLKAMDFNQLHNESLSFIKNELKKERKKTILVTHHLPSNLCNSDEHLGSPINEAFCVDLTQLISANDINFWIYGHSHYNQKPLIIEKTLLLTNQLGYVHMNEHLNFKTNAYFVI